MKLFSYLRSSLHTSPVRAFEYDQLSHKKFNGKVLDLGGGKKAGYTSHLHGTVEITSVNIDKAVEPTIVHDLSQPLPFSADSFDSAISFNTFEHLKDIETPLGETFRVLKNGGTVTLITPFLKEIHASPDDYWRPTESAWRYLLTKNGFEHVTVVPLGLGLFTARYGLIYGPLPRIMRPLFALCSYVLDSLLLRWPRYKRMCGAHIYPLAYLVTAAKPKAL